MESSLLLLRNNLRLADHAALHSALEGGCPVLPVFVLDDHAPGRWRLGGAARWWLHHSLHALGGALRQRGSALVLMRGDTVDCLRALLDQHAVGSIHLQHDYAPWDATLEQRIRALADERGVEIRLCHDRVLFPPEQVRNQKGLPFRVFTPFWRHCLKLPPPEPPIPTPHSIPAPKEWPRSLSLGELELLPQGLSWPEGLAAAWQPGEDHAQSLLHRFAERGIDDYHEHRDRPDLPHGTSRLSPHIRFGEIGPRTLWHHVSTRQASDEQGTTTFLREIGWREFCYHLLHHFPDLPEQEFRPEFRLEFGAFPWRRDDKALRTWQQGRTGIPIVDAGMRQLRRTGWMHNRARMIVASFLTKNLLIDWRAGQDWFWDNLVDADIANNSASWQWVAGCGADAAPYFRIFNPVLQGRKFDPNGDYVRTFVPELKTLDARTIHEPWRPTNQNNPEPPTAYPSPMISLPDSRNRALAAYRALRES